MWKMGFPGGKESTCKSGATGDMGLIPGSGRSPRGGHGNLLQYSYLENPMDREACWATVHRVTKLVHLEDKLIKVEKKA